MSISKLEFFNLKGPEKALFPRSLAVFPNVRQKLW